MTSSPSQRSSNFTHEMNRPKNKACSESKFMRQILIVSLRRSCLNCFAIFYTLTLHLLIFCNYKHILLKNRLVYLETELSEIVEAIMEGAIN